MQRKSLFLYITLLLFSYHTQAQQTVGLFQNKSNAFEGYTLFAPVNNTNTYLIDNCGEQVHSWPSEYRPGLSCYLLDNGVLLRTGRNQGTGMASGIVQMIDWEGDVIWEYSALADYGRQHHDIAPLPNGNILLIVNDRITEAEVAAVGSSTIQEFILSEQLIEIQPNLTTGETEVVWQWRVWDHLVQDVDMNKPNFGTIAQHPARIDINYTNHDHPDWLHFNAVDYNATLDQIIVSVHRLSEFWIIDHSTTTAEAADTVGGIYGKGGDLLYRWGNPQVYDQGTPDDQQLFSQHHTHWIPDSLEDAGKIMLFNNRAGSVDEQEYSTIDIIDTPVDANGFYEYTGVAYAPMSADWRYQAPNPEDFFSNIISGVQRLPNGHTLICEGVGGRFFEIDESDAIVWEYINPVNNAGPITQSNPTEDNNVFRCTKYALDYAAFDGKDLSPQGQIEIGSDFDCAPDSTVAVVEQVDGLEVLVYPNPTTDYFTIEMDSELLNNFFDLKIYNSNAQVVYQLTELEAQIATASLPRGLYWVQLNFGEGQVLKRVVLE